MLKQVFFNISKNNDVRTICCVCCVTFPQNDVAVTIGFTICTNTVLLKPVGLQYFPKHCCEHNWCYNVSKTDVAKNQWVYNISKNNVATGFTTVPNIVLLKQFGLLHFQK